METFGTISELRNRLCDEKNRGMSVAFVPTMGALHPGHGSCIEIAREIGDVVVVSIFVNPTQFGPTEDLDRYPNTLDADLENCRSWGVDVVFVPEASEIYPAEQKFWVEIGKFSEPLCGRTRVGHFRGVATVVLKLFNIVDPDVAVFGQKDAQQAVVIREMARQLNLPVRIALSPTVRETDGLAWSSRNRYLGPEERERASSIYQALLFGKKMLVDGERRPETITEGVRKRLDDSGIDGVEYVELVDAASLGVLDEANGKVLLAVAVKIGTTRLIDNLVLEIGVDGVVTETMLF
ncbi:MAG: pantoate--beta-alanine ligase [Candidatus Latescibacterota bacterium]|nr:MAG: pantoate--beta-alanine ligase [Candidatus Latescibacterota bacterium]